MHRRNQGGVTALDVVTQVDAPVLLVGAFDGDARLECVGHGHRIDDEEALAVVFQPGLLASDPDHVRLRKHKRGVRGPDSLQTVALASFSAAPAMSCCLPALPTGCGSSATTCSKNILACFRMTDTAAAGN